MVPMLAISIHAPAQGATDKPLCCMNPKQISIHAPAQGATLERMTKADLIKFQFTLPHRERLCAAYMPV